MTLPHVDYSALQRFDDPDSWFNGEWAYIYSRNYSVVPVWDYMYRIDLLYPNIQLSIRNYFRPRIALEIQQFDKNLTVHCKAEGYINRHYCQCFVGFECDHLLKFLPYFKVVDKFNLQPVIEDSINFGRLIDYDNEMHKVRESIRKAEAAREAARVRQAVAGPIDFSNPDALWEDYEIWAAAQAAKPKQVAWFDKLTIAEAKELARQRERKAAGLELEYEPEQEDME